MSSSILSSLFYILCTQQLLREIKNPMYNVLIEQLDAGGKVGSM